MFPAEQLNRNLKAFFVEKNGEARMIKKNGAPKSMVWFKKWKTSYFNKKVCSRRDWTMGVEANRSYYATLEESDLVKVKKRNQDVWKPI